MPYSCWRTEGDPSSTYIHIPFVRGAGQVCFCSAAADCALPDLCPPGLEPVSSAFQICPVSDAKRRRALLGLGRFQEETGRRQLLQTSGAQSAEVQFEFRGMCVAEKFLGSVD